jgi:hypothetical protein
LKTDPAGPSVLRRALWIVLGALMVGGGWLLVAGRGGEIPPLTERRDERAPSTRGAAAPPRTAAPSFDEAAAERGLPLPDGALGPIIGDPRLDRIPLCDERNWGMLDGLVHEVRDGELHVEETAWENAGASVRAGVASWASKCRLADAPVLVRGAASGREVGQYDPASGYARSD